MPQKLAVAQIKPDEEIPKDWLSQSGFWTISKTADEISFIAEEKYISAFKKRDSGWRGLKLKGVYDFSQTGILESILKPLADAKVGILAVSTFNTDYVLVKETNLEKAKTVLMGKFLIVEPKLETELK